MNFLRLLCTKFFTHPFIDMSASFFGIGVCGQHIALALRTLRCIHPAGDGHGMVLV
jgi:hypothetical protein